MEDIKYRVKLSNELSQVEVEDFIYLFNKVFFADHDEKWFKWKYLDNIYGPSYVVLAYSKDKLVGIRSFWRNDLSGIKSYQPCDTAVHMDYRYRGIFSSMTLRVLEEIGGEMVYNYPNDKSYPGYIKLGWEIKDYFYLKFVINKKKLREETHMIAGDYLRWKFIDSPLMDYSYYEYQGDNYLLFKRNSKLFYVLGRFHNKYKGEFQLVKSPILFNYTKEETLMYKLLKNRARIVTYDKEKQFDDVDVPIYKGDFF